jgi:hypothetical protein
LFSVLAALPELHHVAGFRVRINWTMRKAPARFRARLRTQFLVAAAFGGSDGSSARQLFHLMTSEFALVFILAAASIIGNQIVTAGQLHVDLGEGVFDTVARIDQSVVDTDRIKRQRDNYRQEYQK